MKLAILLLAMICQASANLDDVAGWHTCIKPLCNPGGSGVPTIVDDLPVSNITRDGSAMQFTVGGPKNTNALWYIYTGNLPEARQGLIDLWVYLPTEDAAAQAFEFDAFQYVAPVRYMFGHQCDQLGTGKWDVWDMLHGKWLATNIPCELTKDTWHHIQLSFHRSGTIQYYDTIVIDGHVNGRALRPIAVADESKVVGVAIVGRPIARLLDDGWTLEVNRTCTDGTKNANSMLYGACRRAAFALGYRKLITYTLPTESGVSLNAAGWKCLGKAGGGRWSRVNRPRVDCHPMQVKLKWEAHKDTDAARRKAHDDLALAEMEEGIYDICGRS